MSVLRGSLEALKGGDWRGVMDISRPAFSRSFVALAASVPLYVFCAFVMTRNSGAAFPIPVAIIIASLMALTFPVIAYLAAQLMSRMEVFRPWVIVRNWTVLGLVAIMAIAFALAHFGILPIGPASMIALLAYLGTLLADIRLAQTAAEMNWMESIFTACAISVAGLLVLLASFASIAGY